MTSLYETNFTLELDIPTDEERVEIRNPSASTKHLHITRVGITSQSEFAVFRLTRYNELATHGTGGDAPTAQTVYKWLSDDAATSMEIYSGEPGVQLIWPNSSAIDYLHDFQLDPSDAGDDDKLQFNQYLSEDHTVVILPNTSASLQFPAGQGTFIVKILARELLVQPVAHIASAALPGSGAYTTASYFNIPEEWTDLTFLVTYTAAGGSTNARPKTRVSWSDGTNSFIQPIVETSLDVSAAPVARRNQYELEQRWPSAVTASATIRFAVPIERMPGLGKVRLDVAELGDMANPGTVAVTIMGGRS